LQQANKGMWSTKPIIAVDNAVAAQRACLSICQSNSNDRSPQYLPIHGPHASTHLTWPAAAAAAVAPASPSSRTTAPTSQQTLPVMGGRAKQQSVSKGGLCNIVLRNIA
jgi:hypothetical protein